MKKLLTLTLVVTALFISSTSYSQAYKQGDKLFTVGLGLSSLYYGTPIGASFESGINENISVGVQIDYNSGNYGSNSIYNVGYTAYYVGARGSYHLAPLLKLNDDKIDVYAGLGLGYRGFSYKDSAYGTFVGSSFNGLQLNYFIGGKYYFTEKIGAFLELGYTGISSSRIGLAVKF